MSILIDGIKMPKEHHVDGYYIDHKGYVYDISRKRVIGKAEEMVKCGECQHNGYLRDCPVNWWPKSDDDYCSFGER